MVVELALDGDGLVELTLGDEDDVLWEKDLNYQGDVAQNDLEYVLLERVLNGELMEEVLVEVAGDAKGEGVALEEANVHVISTHQE